MAAPDLRSYLTSTVTEWGSSRASEWRRCPKAHWLKHHLRIVPTFWEATDDGKEPAYFSIGQLVHAGIHYMADGAMQGEVRDPIDITTFAVQETDTDAGVCYEAERLLLSYTTHFGVANAGFDDRMVIKAAELHVECVDRFAAPETRRLDLVVQAGSELMIVDHKTRKSKLPEDRDRFARGVAVSPAVVGQSWLAKLHYNLDYLPMVMLNCIIKTKVPKFDRIVIKPTVEDLKKFLRVREHESRLMLDEREPIENLDACAPAIGSRCQWFNWCHGGDELREAQFKKGQNDE